MKKLRVIVHGLKQSNAGLKQQQMAALIEPRETAIIRQRQRASTEYCLEARDMLN